MFQTWKIKAKVLKAGCVTWSVCLFQFLKGRRMFYLKTPSTHAELHKIRHKVMNYNNRGTLPTSCLKLLLLINKQGIFLSFYF